MPDSSVSPQVETIPCLMGYFKLTALLEFEAESAALSTLPPTILNMEGIRNGRAEGHQEPRVIPSDDSHAFQVFKEFLQTPRLNTAHTQPVTPILSRQLAQSIEDDVQVQRGAGLRGVLISVMDSGMSASPHLSVQSVLSGTTASTTGCTSARRSASPPSAPEISNVASARVTESAGDGATYSITVSGAAQAAAGEDVACSVTGAAQVPAGGGSPHSITGADAVKVTAGSDATYSVNGAVVPHR